jgi:hypothetical protein
MTTDVVTTDYDFGLGVFILPQPKDAKEYVKIPRLGRTIPFGYVIDETDDGWLVPVPLELEALEKAKKHLKQYSSTYRELADRYEKALKKAQEYEKRTGTGQDSFFDSDRFVQLSATFSARSTDS